MNCKDMAFKGNSMFNVTRASRFRRNGVKKTIKPLFQFYLFQFDFSIVQQKCCNL